MTRSPADLPPARRAPFALLADYTIEEETDLTTVQLSLKGEVFFRAWVRRQAVLAQVGQVTDPEVSHKDNAKERRTKLKSGDLLNVLQCHAHRPQIFSPRVCKRRFQGAHTCANKSTCGTLFVMGIINKYRSRKSAA